MKHIHPFPARMAPDVALDKVQTLANGQVVLDPMAGSGMVLSQAVRSGINAIGVDMDPLAELISRVGASEVDAKELTSCLNEILLCCTRSKKKIMLEWVDADAETAAFVDFWFAPKQKEQLRKLSYCLCVNDMKMPSHALDVIKVAMSRLIVTKEPKASLARDTAHSRPHRTVHSNDFDVLLAMTPSLNHVISALNLSEIRARVVTHLGDARNLHMIASQSVDGIVTSPPYLNAIDYMRGHRLSLVWMGYRLGELRTIRSNTIGAERGLGQECCNGFKNILSELSLKDLPIAKQQMLNRYYEDLLRQTSEAYRVLKRGGCATYVIGNSTAQGTYIRNSEFLKIAGFSAGFDVVEEVEREIPNNKRYMPVAVSKGNSLANRMRSEHVIDFRKPH